jgi:succinoglycan biosynthesis protein ExoA
MTTATSGHAFGVTRRNCRAWAATIRDNDIMRTTEKHLKHPVPRAHAEVHDPIHLVTVIVPMVDEIDHVDHLIDDICSQDYTGELAVIVADGGSTDGSRQRLELLARDRGLPLTLLENPDRIVATGLNACIHQATGDLIVRLDCHSRYPADYLRRCVEAATETGAWNVGGVYEPVGRTRFERAVACALASPFGGVNWTRSGDSRREADTVYLGAFRPLAFERAGLYDETLVRNQDDELNLRIRLAGGQIVHDPAISSTYTPRGSMQRVWTQYQEYGYWKVVVMRKHRRLTGARSLAPAALVIQIAVMLGLAPLSVRARRLLGVTAAGYSITAAVFATRAVTAKREDAVLVPTVAAVFPTFHLGYGLGMVASGIQAIARRGPFKVDGSMH